MSYTSSFSTSGGIDDEGDADLVYYNADIINNKSNDPTAIGDTTQVKFSETRSAPIINNISKYEFSITRFTMNNGPNLPILIPTIEIGQSDINRTTYSITVRLQKNSNVGLFDGFSQKVIEYESETTAFQIQNAPLPQPPLEQQDTRGVYYWVYTYEWFCYLVNKTIAQCWSDLFFQYNVFIGNPQPMVQLTTKPPFLTYNGATGLFSIYYDCNGFGPMMPNVVNPTQENFTMSFNTNLFNLLSNFLNVYVGSTVPNSETNQLLVANNNFSNWFQAPSNYPNNVTPQPASNGYWVMTQNCVSTSTLWSPISSIVFTSTLIPIINEQIGAPIVYGNTNDNTATTSSLNFQPIITDISLPLERACDYREFIQYTPTAEYRMSSFTRSRQPLTNIDIQVFFKYRLTGELVPIRMANYSSVSLKMMFRKKK